MKRVPAGVIRRERVLDPQIFCGRLAGLLSSPATMTTGELGARVVEGWRIEEGRPPIPPDSMPLYRPANVGNMELDLEPVHCQAPKINGPWCVEPGDVLVKKIEPIRAAWITSRVFRHPADANCYLVRGLDPATGFWVALCLNQPAYGHYMVRKSGAAVLPRVRMWVLRSLPVPPLPVEIGPLAQEAADCLDERVAQTEELARLRREVDAVVSESVPSDLLSETAQFVGSRCWYQFFPSADVGVSWVPGHVAINAFQRHLREDGEWNRLEELLSQRQPPRVRASDEWAELPILRLSNARTDFTIPAIVPTSPVQELRRIFAQPIHVDDVLLSTLVSQPRVAYAGRGFSSSVYVTDHWERLHFRETPGAWALVLNTSPIRDQLRRMAVGSFQQFATPAMLGRTMLPNVPLEVRVRWDSALRQYVRRQYELERRWLGVLRRAYELLRRTHNEYGDWTVPPFDPKHEEAAT